MAYVSLPVELVQPDSFIIVHTGPGKHRKGRFVGDAVTRVTRVVCHRDGTCVVETKSDGRFELQAGTQVRVLV